VIAVIDAASLAAGVAAAPAAAGFAAHDDPVEEVFGDQLMAADLAVLNKADLVETSALADTRRRLEVRLRSGVSCIGAMHGALPASVLLGLAAAAEDDIAARPSCHDLEPAHDHDDFESFVVACAPVADPARFAARLAEIVARHGILRLKGFLDVPGHAFRHVVQAVGPRVERYFDRPWQAGEERLSRLVVIGFKGLDRAAIAAAIEG